MRSIRKLNATAFSTLLVLALIAAVATVGAGVGSVVAEHPDDAPDLTEEANFSIEFPHQTDHYPGNENPQNGSIYYFASGADAFAVQDAEEGVWMDWIIVDSQSGGEDWIDYTECDTDNTAAFGIDRGNNNSGTEYDEDLVDKQLRNDFRDDGITIEFYNWEDWGDPPYMAPEDAIVANQGADSAAGACLHLTDEPGWYQITGFMNATIADNGPNEQPSDDAGRVRLQLRSTYEYVCLCDSKEEAEEQLGPQPEPQDNWEPNGNTGGSDETPTPTPTPEQGESPGDDPTPTAANDPGEDPGDDPTPTAANDPGEDPGDDPDDVDNNQPQTPAGGPGFGAVAAILAVLGGALLARRRS